MPRRTVVPAMAGLLLLFLLAFPPVQAGGPFASILASDAVVDDARLDGELEGATWFSQGEAQPVSVSGRVGTDLDGVSLSAGRARVTVHHSERYAAGETSIQADAWSLDNVTATGAVADVQDSRIIAIPASPGSARLAVEAPSLQVLPGSHGVQRHPPIVRTIPEATIDTGESLRVVQATDGTVRITGSVRLVLTGVDLVLASDSGPQDLHTRRDIEGAEVQVERSSYATRSTVHEAVVDLEDAVIVLAAQHAYVRSALVASEGRWAFHHATGTFGPTAKAADDDPVDLQGPLSALLVRGPGDRMIVALSGTPTNLSIDGQAVALASGSRTQAGTVLAWMVLAVVLASTAHLGAGRRRFRRLDDAMDQEQYDRALTLSHGFWSHPRLAQDATLAAAICLLALGRPVEARGRLAARPHWNPRRRPTRDFLLARAEAALGRQDEAARSLARSLVAEPSLLAAAQADSLLSAILRSARPSSPEEAYA